MDGQRFVETNQTFIGYKVKCVECKTSQINLPDYAESDSVSFEVQVEGFAAGNADNYKMKLIGDGNGEHTVEYSYESQSFRDIQASDIQTKELYNQKRSEIEANQEKQLSELKESRKSEDEEREKWLA